MEIVKIDMKKCNLSEDLAKERSEWRNIIHVAKPNLDLMMMMMMIMRMMLIMIYSIHH